MCATLLLSQRFKTTITTLHLHINSISYYTDSAVTLACIKAPSSYRITFVANQLAKIQIKIFLILPCGAMSIIKTNQQSTCQED